MLLCKLKLNTTYRTTPIVCYLNQVNPTWMDLTIPNNNIRVMTSVGWLFVYGVLYVSPALTPLPHTPTVKCTWWTIVNSHIRVFAQCSVCCDCALWIRPATSKQYNLKVWIHISGSCNLFANLHRVLWICRLQKMWNFASVCEFTYPGIFFVGTVWIHSLQTGTQVCEFTYPGICSKGFANLHGVNLQFANCCEFTIHISHIRYGEICWCEKLASFANSHIRVGRWLGRAFIFAKYKKQQVG